MNKPILRLAVDGSAYRIITANTMKTLLDSMKRRVGGRYEIMVMMKELDIIPDNTTVVNLHLDADTDVNKLLELLNTIAEEDSQ